MLFIMLKLFISIFISPNFYNHTPSSPVFSPFLPESGCSEPTAADSEFFSCTDFAQRSPTRSLEAMGREAGPPQQGAAGEGPGSDCRPGCHQPWALGSRGAPL